MIAKQAKDVLKIEAQAIMDLIDRIGPEFEEAVKMILASKGRLILTGMGKSGLVARKISATMNSTGTPSLFLHPAEAIHGDLGMVAPDDVILALSNSGHTLEINKILPILKKMGAKIISFTGGINSPMAAASDIVIDTGVEREACPMGLAPTASTTATLAMGDALAVALINSRRFSKKDFKKFHPGGSLGERLSISVKEVMFTDDNIPKVTPEATLEQAIIEMDAKGIGATLVVDDDSRLLGIITDGDLRRLLTTKKNIHDIVVKNVMSPSPKTVNEEQTAAEALGIMELFGITHLCITDSMKRITGVLHLHDLFGREEFRLNGNLNASSRPDN